MQFWDEKWILTVEVAGPRAHLSALLQGGSLGRVWSGLNTSSRSIAIIHAWGYGVGFDTLHFFGRSGGTSLGAPCVFHPTPMEVPGTLAHRRSGWWPWARPPLWDAPFTPSALGGVGLPVTFTSQQCSAGRQALRGRGVVPLALLQAL